MKNPNPAIILDGFQPRVGYRDTDTGKVAFRLKGYTHVGTNPSLRRRQNGKRRTLGVPRTRQECREFQLQRRIHRYERDFPLLVVAREMGLL